MSVNNLNFDNYIFNNTNLFDGISEQEKAAIFKNQRTLKFKKGDIIFEEHQEPEFIYKIIEGSVKKYVNSIYNREHIFYICTTAEYLGYHAAITSENYTDSAMAMTDCTLQAIPKTDFLEAFSKSNILNSRLMAILGHEFGVFVNFTKLLAKYTLRERTALHLLILNKKINNHANGTDILIGRNDLGSLIGASMEAVVRILGDFKVEGLISSHRSKIKILNVEGLVKVTNIK